MFGKYPNTYSVKLTPSGVNPVKQTRISEYQLIASTPNYQRPENT